MVKPHAILNWLELTSNYSWKWFKSFTKPYETNINMRILFVKTFLNQVISTHPHFYIYRPNFRVKNIERILYVRNILLTWVGGWRGGGDGREVHLRDVKVIAVIRILRHSHSAKVAGESICGAGQGRLLALLGRHGGRLCQLEVLKHLLAHLCLSLQRAISVLRTRGRGGWCSRHGSAHGRCGHLAGRGHCHGRQCLKHGSRNRPYCLGRHESGRRKVSPCHSSPLLLGGREKVGLTPDQRLSAR